MLSTKNLNIKEKVKDLLDQKGMSSKSLERSANLRAGTITNIINQRLTNPKIKTLVQIAESLDCSIYDLIDLKQKHSFTNKLVKNGLPYPWNIDLYIASTLAAQKYFTKYNTEISLDLSLEIIFEIYIYSLNNNHAKIDDNFAEWIVEKHSRTY